MWIDDQVLAGYRDPFTVRVFVPDSVLVVLGSGNDERSEVDLEACEKRGIPVLRRYGGGGTVVLYPGVVVVSAGCWVSDPFNNSYFFKMLNQAVINSLAEENPDFARLSQAGISDIVAGEKKIAGTSLFRSRNYLLYQASIIVNLDIDLITDALRHPSKEPDYRKGRRHEDFLTSLQNIAEREATPAGIAAGLDAGFVGISKKLLGQMLIDPVEPQMSALQSRLDRAKSES